MLFTLRQLAEKYAEFGKHLYVCYIDFQKAFDSVWRAGLWTVMRFLGYDEKLVRLLESLYNGTMSAVRVDGGLTEWFLTVVGVMQGCILSPLLFSVLLEVVMALALDKCGLGVLVSGTCISDLRFADDISLLASSESELQQLVDRVHTTSSRFGLVVSGAKSEVQCIGRDELTMNISLGTSSLKQTEHFVYLGGTVSADQSCDKDIEQRIGLAAGIVRKLGKVWAAKDISRETKVTLYKTLVQSVVLYNSETWTLKQEHKRKLQVFEMAVLRRICGVTRRDRKRNVDIMNAPAIDRDITDLIQIRRLTYFGHVSRMQPERYPHVLLHGHVTGCRPRGRPRKRWIDNVKEDCSRLEMTLTDATTAATNRCQWRRIVRNLGCQRVETCSSSPRH